MSRRMGDNEDYSHCQVLVGMCLTNFEVLMGNLYCQLSSTDEKSVLSTAKHWKATCPVNYQVLMGNLSCQLSTIDKQYVLSRSMGNLSYQMSTIDRQTVMSNIKYWWASYIYEQSVQSFIKCWWAICPVNCQLLIDNLSRQLSRIDGQSVL